MTACSTFQTLTLQLVESSLTTFGSIPLNHVSKLDVELCRQGNVNAASVENPPRNHRMNNGEYTCVWQHPDWPQWRYDLTALAQPLANVSRAQSQLPGD